MECRALGGPERIGIANRDTSTLHRYCALAAELRQSTADGLDGQTEVVGDVAAIHGQTYLRRRVKSPGHFQQETRNTFRRGLAPKQNHPFPGHPKLPRSEIAQSPGQASDQVDKSLQVAAPITAENYGGHCLGAEIVLVCCLPAEEITR